MSNDPLEVRRFYDHHDGQIIYKGFKPAFWLNKSGDSTSVCTARITTENLCDAETLAVCPGIYQSLLEKEYELRINVFGEEVRAVALFSQGERESIDWRYDYYGAAVPLKEIDLPPAEKARCLYICRQLNLKFAAIDVVVTTSGQYIFLEVNEGGQFLWCEEYVPSIEMLDSFCRLLINDTHGQHKRVHYLDFTSSGDFDRWRRIADCNRTSLEPMGALE